MNLIISPPGLFRFVLALLVLGSHLTRFETVGRLAVLLFFTLSGFWVTRLYQEMAGRGIAAFYLSRYLRIAPLYWIALGFAALLLGRHLNLLDMALLGVASRSTDLLGVSWSLDVELQFYLLLPLLLAIAARLNRAGGLFGLAAVTAAGWALASKVGVVTVLQYLPAFAVGILISKRDWKPSDRAALSSLVAFCSLSAVLMLVPATRIMIEANPNHWMDRDVFAFLWMLPLVPYVANSLAIRSGKLDRDIGNVSYPLYLVHYPIVLTLAPMLPGALGKGVAASASIAMAIAMFWFIDRHLDKRRKALFEPRTPVKSSGTAPSAAAAQREPASQP